MQKTYIASLILIIILAVLVTGQFKINDKQLINTEAQEYMHGLKLYNYDEKGLLKNFISAISWKFIPKNGYSVIKQPNVTIYKYPNYFYNITANSGHLIHKTLNGKVDLIKLSSQVNIKQQYLNNANKKSGFTLTTEYLEFDPKTELAITNQPVVISKPGLLITGTGMNADLKNNQLELHKNVSTKFQSQH